METCSNPRCVFPGTSACSACKTTFYCGPICQTADWTHHKEECPGHLRKVGTANLVKAKGFLEQQNWTQVLRYSDRGNQAEATKRRPRIFSRTERNSKKKNYFHHCLFLQFAHIFQGIHC